MIDTLPVRRKTNTPQQPANQQAGMKKVRTTEEYITPIEEKQATVNIIAREVIEETEEPLDKIDEFFHRIEVEQGWRVIVWQLPSFNRDGRSDSRADKVWMGNIPLDPDHYLETVQDMWGAGTYKFESKDPDSKFGPKWVEHIGPKIASASQQAARNTHYIMQPSNGSSAPVETATPRDTLQELLDAGEKAAKLKKIFGWDQEAQQPQVMPVTATIEPPPLQDRIIEAALNAALKTEKPENIAGLLQNYLNPKSDDFSWKEIIGEVVKPMLPMFMGLIAAYAQRQGTPQPNSQPVMQVPQQIPMSADLQQAPPLEQQGGIFPPQFGVLNYPMPAMEIPQNAPNVTMQREEEAMSQEEEEEIGRDDLVTELAYMLEECVRRAMSDPATIAKGREEVIKYRKAFPFMGDFLDALISYPPEVLIGLLSMKVPEVASLINNDVAKQTIRDFQASLREPIEQ